jgi:hypothetical protein
MEDDMQAHEGSSAIVPVEEQQPASFPSVEDGKKYKANGSELRG